MSALKPAPSNVQTARDGGDVTLLVLEENGDLVDHVLELLLKKMARPGRSCAAGVLESTYGALDGLNGFVNPIGRVAHLFLDEDVGEPVVAGDVEEAQVEVSATSEPKCPRCWNHRELGGNANHAEVCKRCGDVLDQLA